MNLFGTYCTCVCEPLGRVCPLCTERLQTILPGKDAQQIGQAYLRNARVMFTNDNDIELDRLHTYKAQGGPEFYA